MGDTLGISPETANRMRIPRDNTVAIIIDIQERLVPHIHDNETIAGNTEILIKGMQVLGIPIHVTQQYSKGLGHTIPRIESLFESFGFIEKTAFSCCDEQDLVRALKATGKKYVLIAGIESHVCVLQTVIDLMDQGYVPVVIEDCVSSRKPSDKSIAMERMRSEGAIISSYESILFELCRFSGTEEFKSISKLVK